MSDRAVDGERRAQWLAEQTRGLQQVTEALLRSRTPGDVAEVAVRTGVAALGARAGSLILRSASNLHLELVEVQGGNPSNVRKFVTIPLDTATAMPMLDVVRGGEAIWIRTKDELRTRYPEMVASVQLPESNDAAWAYLPIVGPEQCEGVLTFRFDEAHTFPQDERVVMLALARQASQALDRARLYEAEQAALARLGVLADASKTFQALGLELAPLLDSVVHKVGEVIGDACAIQLVTEDRRRTEVTAAFHRDPEALAFARELLKNNPLSIDEGTNRVVIGEGRSLLVPVVDLEQLRRSTPPGYRPFLDRFGMKSLLVVPLRSADGVLGSLMVYRTTDARPYTAADQQLLEELADRAALAITTARSFEEARKAIRMRDEFLSIASHELKTPISSLALTVGLIVRGFESGKLPSWPRERVERSSAAATRQIKRLTRLIDDLLDVSRIAAGRLTLDCAKMDLSELAREVVERFADASASAGCELTIDAAAPVLGHWDRHRLDQVLTNLIANALKYGERRPVLVRVEATADGARVTVRDRGLGIAPENHARVFERFERVASSDHGGVGVGLWIVKQIVDAHGGSVSVHSALEHGAELVVDLPRGADRESLPH